MNTPTRQTPPDVRQLQIDRDALIIIGRTADSTMVTLHDWATAWFVTDTAALTVINEAMGSAEPLRRLIRHDRIPLGCVEAFNHSAWLGETGILAQYRAAKRGHRCSAGGIDALVLGIAGRLGCSLYRGDDVVALIGYDSPGKRIWLAESHGDPMVAAEIIWQAADVGAELAASMVPDDDVTHRGFVALRVQSS